MSIGKLSRAKNLRVNEYYCHVTTKFKKIHFRLSSRKALSEFTKSCIWCEDMADMVTISCY